MSVRRMLYLVSFLMTLFPLALFSYYEYGQVNMRITDSAMSMLAEVSEVQSDILLDINKTFMYRIEANANEITDSAKVSGWLKTAEGIETLSAKIAETAEKIGFTDNNVRNVEYMMITDSEGLILAANVRNIIGESVSIPNSFTEDGVFLSELTESEFQKNEYGLWMSVPVDNEHALLSFISLEAYTYQLNRIKLGQTGYAFIADKNGVIACHPVVRYIGTAVNGTGMSNVAADYADDGVPASGVGEGTIFGLRQLYSYRVVPGFNCVVFTVQDKNEILDGNWSFMVDVLVVAALFMVISLAIVVPLLKSRIIKPIFELKRCMNNESGDGFSVCDMNVDSEMGELIDGYNHMVEQLKDQMSSLKLTNEALIEAEEKLRLDKEKLRISEQRFQCATQLSTIAIFELVTYTNEFYCSEGWETITSYKPQSIYPLDYVLRTIIHQDYRASVADWLDKMDSRYDEDLRIITSDGGTKWVHISMAAVDDDTMEMKKISGTLTDINERMVAIELTNYVAYHESLTGFPRRVLYISDISKRLPLLDENTWGAVLILSMENIRRVNDIFGFDVGDQVIILIAAELSERFGEKLYCARNSGNSFLLFCETPKDIDAVHDICDKLLNIFRSPFQASDMSVLVKAHIGVALYPDHGTEVEELLQNADIAMHESRYVRKDDSTIFDPIMLSKVRRTHQIMEVLRDFEANKALYTQYQPIVNMERRCIGFEALVRMDISPIGYISPVEFIPLAEESKMIIPIGKAILKNSCLKAMELFEKGYDFDYISVNVSTVQLEDDGFLDMFYSVVEETGIEMSKIQIEVTESIMITDIEVASEKLGKLRKHGVKIALDDFGTGYSSMKYLRVIPLDVIKIDKHFIDEINNEQQQLFAFTMIQMAHEMGLKVVAEGVESEAQFELLRARDCDSIQGYLTGRPLFEANIEEFLKQYKR